MTRNESLGRFGLKIAICPIFMKFRTQNKSNMLIIYILIGIYEFDQNYKFAKFGRKTEIFFNFYEIWHSQQIDNANYEYDTLQYLEHSRSYWLRMIVGSEWW